MRRARFSPRHQGTLPQFSSRKRYQPILRSSWLVINDHERPDPTGLIFLWPIGPIGPIATLLCAHLLSFFDGHLGSGCWIARWSSLPEGIGKRAQVKQILSQWTSHKFVVHPLNSTHWGYGTSGERVLTGLFLQRIRSVKCRAFWYTGCLAYAFYLRHLSLAASLILQTQHH